MRKFILLFFSFFLSFTSLGQVSISEIPQEKQLIGRNLSTNQGEIIISGEVNSGPNYNLIYDNWNSGEPNDNPAPENAGEMFGNNSILAGLWNDASADNTKPSYVEYEGEINSLGDLVYLGQYNGHSYFKNTSELNWENAKNTAEALGGYLSSHQTIEENNAVASMGDFRGWIGLYQDTSDSNYSEADGGWKWLTPSNSTVSYSSIFVELYRNNTLLDTYTQILNFTNDFASFNFSISITAELAKHSIKVYAENSEGSTLIREVNDIVCGDVFIVQGQSNAAAVMYSGSSAAYQSDYIRVYAGGATSSSGLINNDQWYYGQGDGNENSNGNTGQWGIVIGKMLVDELNIPIAIFNGAHGGQPIEFFQRPNDYTSSTNSNYGRLYYRLNKTGLKSYVRGVLWSQGESNAYNGGLSTDQYKSYFENLISHWQEDYPNIEQYYIFQTRSFVCGTSLSGSMGIKEAQRLLALDNNNVSIMPTTGISLHSDNCHFPFSNGYEKFGTRIIKPLLHDIYGVSYQEEINAPMISDINLSNGNTQLEIVTNASSLMINTTNEGYLLNKLTNDFVLTNANDVSITGFDIIGNSIVFSLNGDPSSEARLSFYGQYEDLEDNITNTYGLELVSFSNYCISGNCNQNGDNIANDVDKKSALVFVENGDGNPYNGQTYVSSVRGASRNGNGNSNDAFGNIGDWSVDFTVSEKTPEQAAQQHGGFTENGHPLYDQGDGNWTLLHNGMGAVGWGSFTANAYNRGSGLGAVAMGFSTIAGPQTSQAGGIDGGNVGQFSAGWASRAIGNISTATGFRNTASGQASAAFGNFNYATGDSSIAMGKENWAQGASTIAMGEKSHAVGGGSMAMGRESLTWGTTNFASGYQTIAGDTSAAEGTGGSATAMGHGTFAQGRSSFAGNKYTSATNQAAAAIGIGTTADNFGMLAIGVNNAAGIGDTTVDPNDYGGYYYMDGTETGSAPGVAFVIGNGDINSNTGNAGDNPSNAFIVNFDGSATLSSDLTINSDTRLKANITSLGNTLPKLLLLDGKKYTLKNNETIEKIGLLAQDVQKLFPQLVKESENSQTLSLFYQGLVPILINAIKDQQKQLEELRKKLKNKSKK